MMRRLSMIVLVCMGLCAQSLEVASVKSSPPDSRARAAIRGGPGTGDPGQITYTNVPLFNVLLRAYDIKSFQLSGPDWLQSRKYDIVAKVPAGTTKEQFGPMLRKLLEDRFHVQVHHETREMQGFQLVAGKNAPKLHHVDGSDSGDSSQPAVPPKTDVEGYPILDNPGMALMEGVRGKAVLVFVTAKSQPISALTDLISREFRLPVQDDTGLRGLFDFRLEFAPQPPGASPALEPDDAALNLIAAIPQQLGLRLLPRKVSVRVVVVDKADQVPVEN